MAVLTALRGVSLSALCAGGRGHHALAHHRAAAVLRPREGVHRAAGDDGGAPGAGGYLSEAERSGFREHATPVRDQIVKQVILQLVACKFPGWPWKIIWANRPAPSILMPPICSLKKLPLTNMPAGSGLRWFRYSGMLATKSRFLFSQTVMRRFSSSKGFCETFAVASRGTDEPGAGLEQANIS